MLQKHISIFAFPKSGRLLIKAASHLFIASMLLLLPAHTANFPASADFSERNLSIMDIQSKEMDPRAQILRDYFAKYNSPLTSHAQDFIDAADAYGLDWKLVPSITGVESTFGKHVPGGLNPQTTSYNGWGWGVYGNQAIYFKSWREGIFTVSRGLRERYINRGLTNPYAMNRVYAASPTWGAKVTHFMEDLTQYESNYSKKLSLNSNISVYPANLSLQEAGGSANLYSGSNLILNY